MTRDSAIDTLITFIVDTYMVERDDVRLDESLIDEGIIDSFGLIEIAAFLERTFEFTIEEVDLNGDNFGSIYKMVDFVGRNVGYE